MKISKKLMAVITVAAFISLPTLTAYAADDPPSTSTSNPTPTTTTENPPPDAGDNEEDNNSSSEESPPTSTTSPEPPLPPVLDQGELASSHMRSGSTCVIKDSRNNTDENTNDNDDDNSDNNDQVLPPENDTVYSLGDWSLDSGEIVFSLSPIKEDLYESDPWPSKISGNSSGVNLIQTVSNQIAWVLSQSYGSPVKALAILDLQGKYSNVVKSCVNQITSEQSFNNIINEAKAKAGPKVLSFNDMSNFPVNTYETLTAKATYSSGTPISNFSVQFADDGNFEKILKDGKTNQNGELSLKINTELTPEREIFVKFHQSYPTAKTLNTSPGSVILDNDGQDSDNSDNEVTKTVTITTNMTPDIKVSGKLNADLLLSGDSVKATVDVTNTFNHSLKGTITLSGPLVTKDKTCTAVTIDSFKDKTLEGQSFEFTGDKKDISANFENLEKGCYSLEVYGDVTDIPEGLEKVSFKKDLISSVYVLDYQPEINILSDNKSSENSIIYEYIVKGDVDQYKVTALNEVYGKDTEKFDASCSTIENFKEDSENVGYLNFPLSIEDWRYRALGGTNHIFKGKCYQLQTIFYVEARGKTFEKLYKPFPTTAVTDVKLNAVVHNNNIEKSKTGEMTVNISGIRDIKGKLRVTEEAADSYSIYQCNVSDSKINFHTDLNAEPVIVDVNGSGEYKFSTPKAFTKACNRLKVEWIPDGSQYGNTFYSNNFLVGVNQYIADRVFGSGIPDNVIVKRIFLTFGASLSLIVLYVGFSAFRSSRKHQNFLKAS